ncbi:response regulator [Desulfococcaceae bacterium HSG7]|nr:response regulator [Desulfococcaceae bacterium HSG7]
MTHKPRILVVDDEPTLLDAIEAMLFKEGYDLVFAQDGHEALAKAAETPPDLILLDLMMPGMDGFEVCERLRADRHLGEVPIIMLTAMDDKDSRLQGIKAGADDFIGKPYDIHELRARIRTITRLNRYRHLVTERTRFEQLIRLSPDGILIADAEGSIRLVNPELKRMLGIELEDENRILGSSLFKYIAPHKHEAFTSFLKAAILRKMTENQMVTDFVHVNGESFPVELKAGFFDLEEQPAVQMIVRDITERKRFEREKEDLERQLRQAQKVESIGTLAGGITHDLNNILTPILGFTQLALEDGVDPKNIKGYLKHVLTSTRRACELVKQILTFLRRSDQVLTPINTPIIINEIVKMMKATLPTTIRVTHRIEPKSGPVLANPSQIHQMVLNLCTNASHAMRENGGSLNIMLAPVVIDDTYKEYLPDLKPGPYQCLKISDTGHGMTPEVMEKIFDPYFTTKSQDEGTGLGLSTTVGIVKSCGGDVRVVSEPGQGTTFYIYLPVTETTVSKQHEELTDLERGKGEQILIVDDEPPIVALLEKILPKMGYAVHGETASVKALELVRQTPDRFDLVITDMTMPEMTGLQLSREIMAIRPELPILLCSGFSEKVAPKDVIPFGFKGFISKPINRSLMAKAIRKVFDQLAKIMVIDDDPQIRLTLQSILTDIGYDVIEAANGREGVDLLKTEKVDLVITDILMPEKEGIETIMDIHRDFPDIKIIAISGGRTEYLQSALALGAQRIFIKPIEKEALLEAIKELLQK